MKHGRALLVIVALGLMSAGARAQTAPATFSTWSSDWSPTMSLGQARAAATATLITTGTYAGQVLIAGGSTASANTATAEIYNPATGTGVWANSMAQPRYFHTATTLTDGRILIVGGALNGASGGVAQAELFDPATISFSAAGTLATARYSHTATLLPNGTVLVTGGFGAGGTPLASAEIYTPPSTANPAGSWAPAGSMTTGRGAHTATLLWNGTVLVAGGQAAAGVTSSVELFMPASSTFVPGHAMAFARAYHTATATGGGVIVIGGFGGSGEVKQCETSAGGLFSLGPSLNDARDSHTATALPNGDILVAGGEDATQLGTASVEVLSAATNTFVLKTTMAAGRLYHTATLVPNGDVYVTGGMHYSPSFAVLTSSELYDPLFATPTGALLSQEIENHTATPVTAGLESGRVLVAGGDAGSAWIGTTATTFVMPSATSVVAGPNMITARFLHTATPLPGGTILMVGGESAATPIASAELYVPSQLSLVCLPPPTRKCFPTLRAAAFRATAGTPVTPRWSHTATYIPSINKVLIAGGASTGATGTRAAELYDPTTDSFAATGMMVFDRLGHTATLITVGGQEKVLVTGGWSNAQANTSGGFGAITHTIEIYDPVAGTFSMPAQSSSTNSSTWLVVQRENHQATLLASGQVLITGGLSSGTRAGITPSAAAEVYDPSTGIFTRAGSMTVPRTFHGAALTALGGGKVLVAGGDTAFSGPATGQVDLFDPVTATFTATVEPLQQARSHHTVTPMSDGRLLIFGGRVAGASTITEISKIMN